MNSTSAEKSVEPVSRRYSLDLITAAFLFVATCAVVVWQNSRLGVLWDLSYVLENAHRISLGDIPYRDFPFPYAPLTFLIQVALIKLTGRVFWHHILYCAAAGGLGTVLTWRILLRLLRDTVVSSRLITFLLSVPLIVLGIYCIFPHPFYDPDCTLAILLSVFLLLRLDDASSWRAFTSGVTLVIPLFVKQNIGLAFLLSGAAAIVILTIIEVWQRRPIRRYLFVLLGVALSLAAGIFKIKTTRKATAILPFILIATVNGAFMSQQLWGSTYAIWPLFMILLAIAISALGSFLKESSTIVTMPLVSIVVISLVVSGTFYVWSNERLEYANLSDGEVARSTLPQLKGLSIRGAWIPNFEELVRYTERAIPRDDGLLILPGEDLFYYTTGRHPRFPALLFDHTTNPYSAEEILNLCRERDIRWVIVKQELQLEDDQVDQEKERITEVLEQDFEQVDSLGNYDIYRRSAPDDSED